MKYENRIIAYIDILGFKDILDATVDSRGNDVGKQIDRILDAYRLIRKTWDLDDTVFNKKPDEYDEQYDGDKTVTIFSDTIVVSFLQETESQVYLTLWELRWMIMNLANRGILCRGAVSYGKLIHDRNKIFGPSLVNAYVAESRAALYPRVIVGQEILNLAGKYGSHAPEEEIEFVKELLAKDSDGMYYIEYLTSVQSEFDNWDVEYSIYLHTIRELIENGLKSQKPDIRIKLMWLRERYNKAISLIPKDTVKRLKSIGKPDEAARYKALKKLD